MRQQQHGQLGGLLAADCRREMWLRLPTTLLTRRIYIIILILPGLILLHVLLQSSQLSLAESYRAGFSKAIRPYSGSSIDERVGWHSSDPSVPNRDSIPGLGSTRSGSSWRDFGQRIGRLTGVAAGRRPSSAQSIGNSDIGHSYSFQRSGGSIYEVCCEKPYLQLSEYSCLTISSLFAFPMLSWQIKVHLVCMMHARLLTNSD